jgi:hypothetical protein
MVRGWIEDGPVVVASSGEVESCRGTPGAATDGQNRFVVIDWRHVFSNARGVARVKSQSRGACQCQSVAVPWCNASGTSLLFDELSGDL